MSVLRKASLSRGRIVQPEWNKCSELCVGGLGTRRPLHFHVEVRPGNSTWDSAGVKSTEARYRLRNMTILKLHADGFVKSS